MVVLLAAAAAAVAAPPPVTLWLLPHTHADVGWLQTFDDLARLNVSRILDTVTVALDEAPDRRFAWSEVSFLARWWEGQDAATRAKFERHVRSGRMEFVDGGWSQQDMGCTDYDSMLNNMETGHLWLNATFGHLGDILPRTGWSLDPFGMSSTEAVTYRQMGMEQYVFTRLPADTVDGMKANKSLEFVWEASSSLPANETSIFAHVLESYYCTHTFMFGGGDAAPVTPAEVRKRAADLTALGLERAAWFQTSHVLIPWGCDYMYQDAEGVFAPTEAIMAAVNGNTSISGVRARYGTPREYFAALFAAKQDWPVARTFPGAPRGDVATNGDFFPYIPNDSGAWSGYFTSRPILKRIARWASSALYVAERCAAAAAAAASPATMGLLDAARTNLGILVHHDAITGSPGSGEEGGLTDQATGRHDVLQDYERMGVEAHAAAMDVAAGALGVTALSQLDFGDVLLDGRNATVVLHNPVPTARNETVEVKIPICAVAVTDAATGAPVPSQVHAAMVVSEGDPYYFTLRLVVRLAPYETRSLTLDPCVADRVCPSGSGKRHSVVCYAHPDAASQRPAAHEVYQLKEAREGPAVCHQARRADPGQRDRKRSLERQCVAEAAAFRAPAPAPLAAIENAFYRLEANLSTGPVLLHDKASGVAYDIRHDLVVYPDAGTAYAFRPTGPAAPVLPAAGAAAAAVVHGPIFSEVRWKVSDEHKYWVRLWNSPDPAVGGRVEVGYRVGVLERGTTLAARFATPLRNAKGDVFTESNGYEVLRRSWDPRYDAGHGKNDTNLAAAANFFPAQMSFFVKDDAAQLSVAVDRSRGVGSHAPGHAEVLLHRRVIADVVNCDDVDRQTAAIWLALGGTQRANRLRHEMKLRMAHPVVVIPAAAPHAAPTPRVASLPPHVHLQTFKPIGADTALLRLMHVYARGEDPELSAPATVDVRGVIGAGGRTVLRVVETQTTGRPFAGPPVDPARITLRPFEMRTFRVDFKPDGPVL
eukprot:TRINITY_DN5948_c0_g1_i1.p1 TRINITY_DN5948_c0_g1~~TRINITY_DN5948_c0_g1_i1.p1  ORF type:complete len:991 (+),score=335.32 TRINITY_DN5948_c0_g1_i1:42-3014(+)